MDGAGSKLAVLLMLGALSVGLSACGSESSSSSGSTAPRVKKEAGVTRDTELTVANESPYTMNVKLCDLSDDPCETVDLDKGDSATRTGDRPDGDIRFLKAGPAGSPDVTNLVYFQADNPTIGQPWISVDNSAGLDYSNLTKWKLGEGNTYDTNTSVAGNGFEVKRSDDTDSAVVMRLTAVR
jgi:hypothetical protein